MFRQSLFVLPRKEFHLRPRWFFRYLNCRCWARSCFLCSAARA